MTPTQALEYIRTHSRAFRALGSRIASMQHRAALGRIAATRQHNAQMATDFSATIVRLGTLHNLHASAVAKLDTLNSVLERVGAGPDALGIIPAVIPVIAISLAVGVVAAMGAVIYKANIESQRLAIAEEILASKQPTREKLSALNALTTVANSGGDNPASGNSVGSALTTLLKPLAIGLTVLLVAPKVLEMIGRRV